MLKFLIIINIFSIELMLILQITKITQVYSKINYGTINAFSIHFS